MKKTFLTIIMIFVFFITIGITGIIQTRYTMDGTVIKTYDDIIVLEDVRGHRWHCKGSTDKVNVKIVFCNNGTDNIIEDDFILKIK